MHVLAADRLFLVLVFLNFDFQAIGCRHPALVQPAGGARLEGNPCSLPFGDGLLDVRDGEPDVVHHRSDCAAGRRRRVGPLIENDQDAGEHDPFTRPGGDTAHGEKDMLVGRDVARIEINPDTVEAQIQGAIIFGITAALYGEITLKDGRVQQTNFDTYQMLRIDETPAIDVYVVDSTEAPG